VDLQRGSAEGFLSTADLAALPDVILGGMKISPATRVIRGPKGTVEVEPRVMQVLVVLADKAGKVVSRDSLLSRCWGGVYVGHDSLNRAVSALRRAIGAAGGTAEIETIPRTGYRLTGDDLSGLASREVANVNEEIEALSRRKLISGAIAVGITAGGGAWLAVHRTQEARFNALMAKGDEAFRNGSAIDHSVLENERPDLIALYQQAAAIKPGSASAWGLLAYFKALAADEAPAKSSARLVAASEAAVRNALDLNPSEPNARVAASILQGPMLDWQSRDRQLRNILSVHSGNIPAMTELMPLLQAAGYTRESWMWNERILQAAPLARAYLVIKAMKLWILGNIPASDKVIDRVRGFWPTYDFGYFVRLMLFTLTDRTRAALAMIDGAPRSVLVGGPFWRAAGEALDTRSSRAIEAARQACFDTAKETPMLTNQAVMVLCALGLKDAAFELTDGYLLWRGKAISRGQASATDVNDYSRRMTQWLFTPPVAIMRADRRFQRLCDEFGLTAYWRARGIRPDYQAGV
jgi:DNA-binding winged helix-turn-helix (wHTH) protein